MLALYRRHRHNCKGDNPHNSRTSEYDERKKAWKRCECPIFVSGTLQGTFERHNTGRWEWEDARSIAVSYERAGSWSGTIPEPPQPVTSPSDGKQPNHTTIDKAVERNKIETLLRELLDARRSRKSEQLSADQLASISTANTLITSAAIGGASGLSQTGISHYGSLAYPVLKEMNEAAANPT